MKFLNDKEIGERLETLKGNKSTREIAIGAGIDPSQYGKIEKGKLSITKNILEKLEKVYKWDGNFILHGSGTSVPRETMPIEDKLSDTALRFLRILEQNAETISHQHKTIHELAEKVPRASDLKQTTKNGSPSLKNKKSGVNSG